jgi:hypothetical protein
MDDFLAKPLSMATLKLALSRWLPPGNQAQAAVSTSAPPALRPINSQAFAALVSEITPLLEHNKFEAVSRLRELQALVADTCLAPEVDAMAALLQEMRFDLVLDRLRRMAADVTKME